MMYVHIILYLLNDNFYFILVLVALYNRKINYIEKLA